MIVELPENGLPLEAARKAVAALRGVAMVNRKTGIIARLSSSAKGKLVSNKATGKSVANGFTRNQHNVLAANINRIFELADLMVQHPDREGDVNIISIKRFSTRVCFGKREAVAWTTVKESRQHGHHIYSVEAIKLETLGRKVEVASGSTPHAPSVPTRSIIAKLLSILKRAGK